MNKQMSLNLFREALDAAAEQIEAEMAERGAEILVTRAQHEIGVGRIMEAFRKHTTVKWKRRIWVALLAAALMILTSCTIYANRDKIATFIEEFYHTYIDVSYEAIGEDVPREILELYQPSNIPEGYELAEAFESTAFARTEWLNEQGKRITFDQSLLTTGGVTVWDNERVTPKLITVNDTSVYYAEYNGTHCYMWNDGRYSYALVITGELLSKEIEQLIILTVENPE